MSSQAWPRSAAPHCSLPREGGSQGSGTKRRRTCSQGGPHLSTPPVRGRPAPNRALPGRSRPPAAAVQRRKLFPARTATELSSYLYRLCPRSPVAAATRGAGLLLLSILTDNSGGSSYLLKHRPGVRCCGRRGGLFC